MTEPYDFAAWLSPSAEDARAVAIYDKAPPKAMSEAQLAAWASFGERVVLRLQDPAYQRLITHLLLTMSADGSPARAAHIIRRYIETGALPWSR